MRSFQVTASQVRSGWTCNAASGRTVKGTLIQAGIAVMLAGGLLSGCINIAAPDAPIVIELNINIRQEVIYRLAADAANTIDENEDIF